MLVNSDQGNRDLAVRICGRNYPALHEIPGKHLDCQDDLEEAVGVGVVVKVGVAGDKGVFVATGTNVIVAVGMYVAVGVVIGFCVGTDAVSVDVATGSGEGV